MKTPPTTPNLSDRERSVLLYLTREMTDLLDDLLMTADEYRAGMNRATDLRDLLNTIHGNADAVAKQLEIEL